MALLEEQFTETLQAGAPDITYQGNEGQEQKIARELWDQLPPEAQQKFGSFQQFFSSGAWKQVLQMLQQQMQQQQLALEAGKVDNANPMNDPTKNPQLAEELSGQGQPIPPEAG